MKQICNSIFLGVILILSSFSLNGCDGEELCDILRKIDLVGEKVVKIFNLFTGQPIIDPFTNQQLEANNIFLYNERTGEEFYPGKDPIIPAQVGDVIQVASRIFNQYDLQNECNQLISAPSSATGFAIALNNSPFGDALGFTPAIGAGGWDWALSRFPLGQPGTYSFTSIDADQPNSHDEFRENNNQFNPDFNTNGRKDKPNSIYDFNVENNSQGRIVVNNFKSTPLNELEKNYHNYELIQYLNSQQFIEDLFKRKCPNNLSETCF